MGSNENMRPVCVGVVYFWAAVWPINPIALHSMLNAKIETHDSVVLGRCGFSKNNENSTPPCPGKAKL